MAKPSSSAVALCEEWLGRQRNPLLETPHVDVLLNAVDVGPVVQQAEVWSGADGPIVGRTTERAVLADALARGALL